MSKEPSAYEPKYAKSIGEMEIQHKECKPGG